jgi:hypothetical protein
VRSRQEQLEQDLQRAWSQDPIALLEAKGTPEVHDNGAGIGASHQTGWTGLIAKLIEQSGEGM